MASCVALGPLAPRVANRLGRVRRMDLGLNLPGQSKGFPEGQLYTDYQQCHMACLVFVGSVLTNTCHAAQTLSCMCNVHTLCQNTAIIGHRLCGLLADTATTGGSQIYNMSTPASCLRQAHLRISKGSGFPLALPNTTSQPRFFRTARLASMVALPTPSYTICRAAAHMQQPVTSYHTGASGGKLQTLLLLKLHSDNDNCYSGKIRRFQIWHLCTVWYGAVWYNRNHRWYTYFMGACGYCITGMYVYTAWCQYSHLHLVHL